MQTGALARGSCCADADSRRSRASWSTPALASRVSVPARAAHCSFDSAATTQSCERPAMQPRRTRRRQSERRRSDVWSTLASVEPADAIVLRLSTVPSRIGEMWPRREFVAECDRRLSRTRRASRGVVRCIAADDRRRRADRANSRRHRQRFVRHATVVGERLPAIALAARYRRRHDALVARRSSTHSTQIAS